MRDQKNRSIEATSTVPPLLLGDEEQVRCAARARAAAVVIVRSSVVSRTYELRRAVGHAEHRAHDFRAQAAAAHAEQVDGLECPRPWRLRRARRRARDAARMVSATSSQPSRVAIDLASALPGRGAPDADVAVPDAADDVVLRRASATRAPAGNEWSWS